MSNTRRCHYCQNILVVLGRQWRDGCFYGEPAKCLKEQINNTVIISTPDASNLNDTHMLDLMALTNPGPHLFLVRLDDGKHPERELRKWEEVFGEDISPKMIYITDGPYGYNSRFSVKCISICEDIMKHCEHIINNHTTYSFREFLITRRKKIESKMPAETERYNRYSCHQDFHNPFPGGQQKSRPLTLVVLGESGSGKSASGNTIMGERVFTSRPSSIPVTTGCKMETKSICGTEVRVIDTPDFFDEDLQMQSRHILDCRELCEGGLCVYLLAIQIGRFTDGERDILKRLESALQTRVRDKAIILFTRADDLTFHIDEYVRNTSTLLKKLIEQCGGRYQMINNKVKEEAEHQIKKRYQVTQQPKERSFLGHFWPGGASDTTSYETEADNQMISSDKREAENQVKELMRKIADLVQNTERVTVFPRM